MEKLKANCSDLNVIKESHRFNPNMFIESYKTSDEALDYINSNFCDVLGFDAISSLLISDIQFDCSKYVAGRYNQYLFSQKVVDIFYWDIYGSVPRVKVIGKSVTKGYELPVFYLKLPEYKLEIIFKSNFRRWTFSISSECKILSSDISISDGSIENMPKDHLDKIYEGIPYNSSFAFYDNKNNRNFVAWFDSDEAFYEFLIDVKHQIREKLKF